MIVTHFPSRCNQYTFTLYSFHDKHLSLDEVFRLGCRVCKVSFAYEDQKARKDWHHHIKFGHRGDDDRDNSDSPGSRSRRSRSGSGSRVGRSGSRRSSRSGSVRRRKDPHSSDRERLLCWFCLEPFPDYEEGGFPAAHMRRWHVEQSFECLLCPRADRPSVFPDLPALRRHLASAHADDPRHRSEARYCRMPADVRSVRCKACGDRTSFHAVGTPEVMQHFLQRHPQQEFRPELLVWTCRLCQGSSSQVEFSSEEELARHIDEKHK